MTRSERIALESCKLKEMILQSIRLNACLDVSNDDRFELTVFLSLLSLSIHPIRRNVFFDSMRPMTGRFSFNTMIWMIYTTFPRIRHQSIPFHLFELVVAD